MAPKQNEKWGKLPDDFLDVIADKRDQLAGSIQETHGITKDWTRAPRDTSGRSPNHMQRAASPRLPSTVKASRGRSVDQGTGNLLQQHPDAETVQP